MKSASEGECVAIRERNRKKKCMKKSNRTRLDIEKKEGQDSFDRDSFDCLELGIMKKERRRGEGLKLRGSHTITQLDLMSRIMKITRSFLFINPFYRAWVFHPEDTPSINRQNER